MIKKNVMLALAFLSAIALSGCATKASYVDTSNDEDVTLALNYKDFEKAANTALESLAAADYIQRKEGNQRLVVAISNIVNDTQQRIDTDQLTKKVRIGMLRDGRFVVTTAINLNGGEEKMVAKVRELSNSKMVNQATVKGNGTVLAPDYSLSGKIIQRNYKIDRSTQQLNYFLQMTMTDLSNGLAMWEEEVAIIKKGDNRSVTW